MPEPAKSTNPLLRAGFDSVRRDFESLRQQRIAIRAVLIHEASNVQHYGVQPYPYETEFGYCGKTCAGMREGGLITDANGLPQFADEPELDAHGQPIVNTAGDAFAIVMPAARSVAFFGEAGPVARLLRVGVRAAALITQVPRLAVARPAGWRFSPGTGGLWWAMLFEYAWTGAHPLLKASRYLYHSARPSGFIRLPHDRDQLRQQLESGVSGELFALVPRQWVNRLPDAYASHIDDAATACCEFLDVLVEPNSADPNKTAISAAPKSSSFRRVGECWQLRFVAADGTIEVPPPFKDLRGFEIIHSLLYEPGLLADEFRGLSAADPIADEAALKAVRAQLEACKSRYEHAALEERIELEDEIRKLEMHIRQATLPDGRRKSFKGDRKRARDRVRAAVASALSSAEKDAPLWVEHLRSSIDYTATPFPKYRSSPPISWEQ